MKTFKIKLDYDGLILNGIIEETKIKPVGIVQISHGMAENIKVYKDVLKFLNSN